MSTERKEVTYLNKVDMHILIKALKVYIKDLKSKGVPAYTHEDLLSRMVWFLSSEANYKIQKLE